MPVEFDSLPFVPQRVFVVVGPEGGATRGEHGAGCRQCMVLVSGVVSMRLSSTRGGNRRYELREPGTMVLIEPDEYVSYDLRGDGCTVIVLADESFRPRPAQRP